MTTESKNVEEMSDEALFEEAIKNLHLSIASQGRAQRRVGNRVRVLIRAAVVGLVLSLSFILYLIYILNIEFENLSTTMDKIAQESDAVQVSMDDIEIVMMTFSAHMDELPEISRSVRLIQNNTANMSDSLNVITSNIGGLSGELSGVRGELQGMTNDTRVLNSQLFQIEQNLDKGSRPIREMNRFMPFGFMQ